MGREQDLGPQPAGLQVAVQVDSDVSHQDCHVLHALADSPGQRLQLSDLAVRIGWERSRVSHQVLEQIHEQILAQGTLPRPHGLQSRWPHQ